MGRISLKDTSFVFPIRIDSVKRLENVLASIQEIIRHFSTNIFVMEANMYNNHILESMLPRDISYSFVTDYDPIFHRTKYINLLVGETCSPYVAIWDADVIIDYNQILEAIDRLREGDYDVVFPYDGRFLDTTEIIRNVFIDCGNIEVLKENAQKMLLPYGSNMGGGAFIVNRQKYIDAGCEDESFYGWGPEDWNRVEKWKKIGYKIKKIDGPLFHLSHPRDLNGRHNSEWQRRYAYNRLRQTMDSNKEEVMGFFSNNHKS